MDTDFIVMNHGSIILLMPCTDHARGWCQEHLPEDAPMFGRSFAVEPRYIGDIVDGVLADGFTVQ